VCNAVRTTIVEPAAFARRVDDCVDASRASALAEAAWEQLEEAHPDAGYSTDFALGFQEGFAAFIYKGGSGNPPPLPPRYYWRPEFDSVIGHVAIQDWFAGYRRGTAAAKASGLRYLVIVPASTALPRRSPPPALPSGTAAGSAQGQVAPPPAEVLPQPRQIPPVLPKEPEAPGQTEQETALLPAPPPPWLKESEAPGRIELETPTNPAWHSLGLRLVMPPERTEQQPPANPLADIVILEGTMPAETDGPETSLAVSTEDPTRP
jgi:hypothetical protein